jgi:RNA polymerase sigma-70 factor (sigma-E family)
VTGVDEAVPLTFEEAFDDCYRAAYRAAFRLLGERGDAEDAAQEAMTRAYTRWRRINAYAESWLVRVATNIAIDSIRRAQRRVKASAPVTTSADDVREQRIDLANALAGLSKRQREVIVLRFLGDRTEDEVARVLGCSVGAVKQHAHRGLDALRRSPGLEAVIA